MNVLRAGFLKKCISLYSQHHHVLTVQKKKKKNDTQKIYLFPKSSIFKMHNLFTIVSSMSNLNIILPNIIIMYFITIGYPKTLLLFPITFQRCRPSRHLFWRFIWDGRDVLCAIKSYHLSLLNKMCFCFCMVSIWINNYFNRFRRFNNFQDI